MNYTDHTTAVTARLVDMIRTGSHGQWAMPWHTHGTAGLFNTRLGARWNNARPTADAQISEFPS